ncbi:MAG: hypothetical protein RL385_2312, partial [Pseudomonadota bacterium]
MQAKYIALILPLGLLGCGADEETPTTSSTDAGALPGMVVDASVAQPPASGHAEAGSSHQGVDFSKLPAVDPGYSRFISKPVEGIKAGADATWCEFVLDAVPEDMNILHVKGDQGAGGHHLTVFGVDKAKMTHPMNTPFSCEPTNG